MSVFKYKYNKVFLLLIFFTAVIFINGTDFYNENDVIIEQIPLEGNNIKTEIINTGIFNQDMEYPNLPGFEWPKGAHKFAVFTTGLSIAAYVNGQLHEAMASYKGELAPGFIIDSSGYPRAITDARFKFYNVKRTDNYISNPDWLNWGLMVPFGAPFVDVDNDGVYEPVIDTPGIRGASQTIFICMTDGFPEEHKTGEGFGGGTLPLYAEIHLTAWCYDNPGYQDMQFLRYDIINKNVNSWHKTYFAVYSDADLGFPEDDYIGCDTLKNLGYCYNADNDDEGTLYSYGQNPPAVGFKLLSCAGYSAMTMKSFNYTICNGCPAPPCELDPNGEPGGAYNFMKGLKKDGTPWVVPNTNPPQTTKFCYSGDPETGTGWTEFGGKIWNCDSMLTGQYQVPVPPGDRRLILGYGSDDLTFNPGDTQKVTLVQLIARGSNNLNSVTLLKQLSDVAQRLCDSGFVIGVNPVSTRIPDGFKLYQNYPNPFNPVTTIKFDIPTPLNPPFAKGGRTQSGGFVRLTIYDILGKEIEVLIDEQLNPGSYLVKWDASGYSSGVYYYVLRVSDASSPQANPLSTLYSETKKMVLIK